MVVAKTLIGNHKNHQWRKKVTTKRPNQDRIKVRKLNTAQVAQKFKEIVAEHICRTTEVESDVESLWNHFKTTILKAVERSVG